MSIWPLSSVWHINMIIFMFSHVSKTMYWQIQRVKVTKMPLMIKYSDYTQSIRIMKWREQWMHFSTIFVILQIFLLNRPLKKKFWIRAWFCVLTFSRNAPKPQTSTESANNFISQALKARNLEKEKREQVNSVTLRFKSSFQEQRVGLSLC